MRARRGGVCALLALLTSVSASAAPTHEVYVWQRQWTPALSTALADSRDDFTGVRILIAQAGRTSGWSKSAADPRAFAHDQRTLTAVIRYDGAGVPPDIAALRLLLDETLARWRRAGASFAAVEIDYDCGSARLADYAQRLRALRAALPAGVRLSITALPAWLDAPALDAVLAVVDEAVLQVHAVQDPAHGLFDAALAERWIRAFAPHTRNGFRVALPAYGARVRFGDDGRALAVESEMKVDAADAGDARELGVEPADVVGLLERLAANPPPQWQGVVWFRLPLPGDRRAWTLAALREVIAQRVPSAQISAIAVTRANGASDIFVINRGVADARVKSLVVDGDGCSSGDTALGWRAERIAAGWRFTPGAAQRLPAGVRRAVGWLRCARIESTRIE
ncbi:MAG TPA: DUF3142 domain-containing protein [Dokdonella sp.]